MGAVASVPSVADAPPEELAEYLIGNFVGEKPIPLTSCFWENILELNLNLHSQPHRLKQACEIFALNNNNTRHLAKILIHLAWCLQDCTSISDTKPMIYIRVANAARISSIFLKYSIETCKSDHFEDLYLSVPESEPLPERFSRDLRIENTVMHCVLTFIKSVDVSPYTKVVHQEVLDFMLVAMSTQLLSGTAPGLKAVNPFIDAAMAQESFLINSVVHKLLLNYVVLPCFPVSTALYPKVSVKSQAGVLRKVGSAATKIVLLPLNYTASGNERSRSFLAEFSLYVLLILIYHHKLDERKVTTTYRCDEIPTDSLLKESTYFFNNLYSKALDNARDTEFDHVDIERNAHNGPIVRIPFASLFDNLGTCLNDEMAVLLLYSLVHGNPAFLDYILVRSDLDTLMMPILETLYNASRKTTNHIYMLLLILLMLSQDSSFHSPIHKLVLPNVPWYKEHRLHQTSLGSLIFVILVRTVNYNLNKLQDVYLCTTCLAILANMAPHVYHLSAYAAQRLVSLFDMLSRKHNKLAESMDSKMHMTKNNSRKNTRDEDMTTKLRLCIDFLRIVLEIINMILTYALPQNHEVVYAIMHRQEVFQYFKNHPRLSELLENIYMVINFFNNRMDTQGVDGRWSVEKVLDVVVSSCQIWHGEGMKKFSPLHFSYEQASHSEDFFVPYIWSLVLSRW